MMVSDTKPENVKRCSRCDETKESVLFIKNRNICKMCSNARKTELLKAKINTSDVNQTCILCHQTKITSCFLKHRKVCYECNNTNRRLKYDKDESHRLKLIQQASTFKHNKVVERQQAKQLEIGDDNKKCSVCSSIKPKCKFRYNRLKCRTCERDDPIDKFKRGIRSRIYGALNRSTTHGKTMNTIKYLGATPAEYLNWVLHNDNNYTLENRGKVWHIDHVIPLSRFDLKNEEEQLVAFNWRNTMPFAAKDNLSKNCKILPSQIEQHYKHLSEYHQEKNMEMPQLFIDLFAKHLVAGIALEP